MRAGLGTTIGRLGTCCCNDTDCGSVTISARAGLFGWASAKASEQGTFYWTPGNDASLMDRLFNGVFGTGLFADIIPPGLNSLAGDCDAEDNRWLQLDIAYTGVDPFGTPGSRSMTYGIQVILHRETGTLLRRFDYLNGDLIYEYSVDKTTGETEITGAIQIGDFPAPAPSTLVGNSSVEATIAANSGTMSMTTDLGSVTENYVWSITLSAGDTIADAFGRAQDLLATIDLGNLTATYTIDGDAGQRLEFSVAYLIEYSYWPLATVITTLGAAPQPLFGRFYSSQFWQVWKFRAFTGNQATCLRYYEAERCTPSTAVDCAYLTAPFSEAACNDPGLHCVRRFTVGSSSLEMGAGDALTPYGLGQIELGCGGHAGSPCCYDTDGSYSEPYPPGHPCA